MINFKLLQDFRMIFCWGMFVVINLHVHFDTFAQKTDLARHTFIFYNAISFLNMIQNEFVMFMFPRPLDFTNNQTVPNTGLIA